MKKSNDTRIGCLDSSNFSKISRAMLPFAKNSAFIGEFGHDRPMKRRIAINGHDEASFD